MRKSVSYNKETYKRKNKYEQQEAYFDVSLWVVL